MSLPWKTGKKPKYVKQELRTSKKPGAKPQMNSGRVWSSLRDVKQKLAIMDHVLIDNKTTDANSYRITDSDWGELKRDANRTPPGCHPALQIDLPKHRLYVVDEAFWDAITDALATAAEISQNGEMPEMPDGDVA